MIPFEEYCARVTAHIESRYRISVVQRDIPEPWVGDLNGAEIHISRGVLPEQQLFLLAHLFGHCVQWNVSPEAVEIGRQRRPPVPEELLPAIVEYEREAASYALTVLRQIGIVGLEQWLADYTACDLGYLMHFYRTGEKLNSTLFWRDNTPLLEARAIPSFTPARLTFRRDGIVI